MCVCVWCVASCVVWGWAKGLPWMVASSTAGSVAGRSRDGGDCATRVHGAPSNGTRAYFHWLSKSKYRNPTFVQQEMMDAILYSLGNGIVISPCGTGKTFIMIDAMLKAGKKALLVCYESVGVHQAYDVIRRHTSLSDSQICVYSGKRRDAYDKDFCFFITTYGMFSSTAAKRNKVSEEARRFVLGTHWDIVCYDEFHHACAPTYKPLVESLVLNSRRCLAFTATLIRSELCDGEFVSAEHEEAAFGWFGNVIFRRKCKQLEEAGLIAKIRRARVEVDLTPEFAVAHEHARGSQKIYISALNPRKLDAMTAIVAMHRGWHHTGIVFVTHLLAAKVVKGCLSADGARCEIVSGGSAHGEDEVHDSAKNAAIVDRFNDKKLDVLIATMVGCGAMDLYREECCYMIVMDADGGLASAGQRLGRVARSVPTAKEQDAFASEGERLQHRLANQKSAAYYDILTRGTADVTAAAKRQILFAMEGYQYENAMCAADLTRMAAESGRKLPYEAPHEQALLLREVLEYRTLGGVCVIANVAASSVKAPHLSKMKAHAATAKNHKSKVMRELSKARLDRARANQKGVDAEAKAARNEVLASAAMSEASRKIFQACDFDVDALSGAGLSDEVIWAPSDDSDEECDQRAH